MKRRTFLWISAGLGAAMAAPFIYKKYISLRRQNQPLLYPTALSKFCDEATIRSIGTGYRKLMPDENDKTKLISLLVNDSRKMDLQEAEKNIDAEILNHRIIADFIALKTLTIDGWVISITEARQCALLSLS